MTKKTECKYCGKKFDSETALQQHQRDKHSEKTKPLKAIKLSTKRIGIYLAVILIVVGLFYGIYTLAFAPTVPPLIEGEATLYMDAACGCCAIYVDYLESRGIPVKKEYRRDLSPIKMQYKIPANMQSCHTTIVGNYFVEGHIPIETIVKLIEEQPDIAGIAMPGMPSGSPGMPGLKTEPFRIYAIAHDGEVSTFMTI